MPLWQGSKSKFSKSDSEFHAEIRKLIENFQIKSTRKKTGFLNFFFKVSFLCTYYTYKNKHQANKLNM